MADTAVETAPADENDDNWLYGESANDQIEGDAPDANEKAKQQTNTEDQVQDEEDKEQDEGEGGETNDDSHFNDAHFAEVGRDEEEPANGDADSQDNGDSDSDDSDDIKVTIGEIKSGPQTYTGMNIKRGVGLVASGGEKPRPVPAAGSKVTLEDLDGPGSINGVPAQEFNIDTIEDKPWNKPGADISDYFNYGFNEVTWSAYCERQRRLRVNEAGVTMHTTQTRAPLPEVRRPQGPPRHEEMPPNAQNYQVRENTIQVMTAERREYGRTHGRDAPPPDYFSAPPPDAYYPPPPHSLPQHAPHAPHASYDERWAHPEPNAWTPTEIKELTAGPPMGPPIGPPIGITPPVGPPHAMPPVHVMGPAFAPPYRSHLPPHAHERERDRERDRDRDRDRERERDRDRLREREERERRDRDRRDEEDRDRERERSRSTKPDRVREKSYRRERSRSRPRRHKSRSRSPRRERSRERERSRDRERSIKPKTKEPKEKDEEK